MLHVTKIEKGYDTLNVEDKLASNLLKLIYGFITQLLCTRTLFLLINCGLKWPAL